MLFYDLDGKDHVDKFKRRKKYMGRRICNWTTGMMAGVNASKRDSVVMTMNWDFTLHSEIKLRVRHRTATSSTLMHPNLAHLLLTINQQ